MAKQIMYYTEAQDALLRGFDAVAEAVGATLGPRGQTVVLSRPFGAPLVTKDGVTVARTISLPDPWENEGAKLIQEVAQKTNTEAGDGTTAATVLARALFAEGIRQVGAGADRRAIERGIHLAVAQVVTSLQAMATAVQQSDLASIRAVATIAANGDSLLGDVIARAIHRVGLEGVITLDQSPTSDTTLEISEGLQFERGFLSPLFITNRGRAETVFDNCNIFVTDRRLIDIHQMAAFLETYSQRAGKVPLLIIAEDCEGGALQILAVNNGRALDVVPVRTPGAGAGKKDELEDIAVFTGARVYSVATGDDPAKIKFEDLGSADRIIVTPHRTTIIGGKGQAIRVDARKDELRTRLADPATKEFARAELERRLAKLSASIAVIKIGASVHSKLLEKRDRVEDSVNATLAALREGIVPGGGTALLRCLPALERFAAKLEGDIRVGVEIVAHAISRPLHTIAANAGVDPACVVRTVLDLASGRRITWLDRLRVRLTPTSRRPRMYCAPDSIIASAKRWGYNAAEDRYEDLVSAGIIDPAKVVRLALQNAAELAGLLLTTAALVVDIPDPAGTPAPPPTAAPRS